MRRNGLAGNWVGAAEGVKCGRRRLGAKRAQNSGSDRARTVAKAVVVDGIQGGQNAGLFEQGVLWADVRGRGIERLTLQNVDHGLRNRRVGKRWDQVVPRRAGREKNVEGRGRNGKEQLLPDNAIDGNIAADFRGAGRVIPDDPNIPGLQQASPAMVHSLGAVLLGPNESSADPSTVSRARSQSKGIERTARARTIKVGCDCKAVRSDKDHQG